MNNLDLTNYDNKKLGAKRLMNMWSNDSNNSHPIHTPIKLCEEILEKFDNHENKSWVVIYNPEFIWVLKNKYNVSVDNIILWTRDYSEFHKMVSDKFGCVYWFGDFEDMKFDCIVGNPPFNKQLWKEFFYKSLNVADVVSLIGPDQTSNPIDSASHKKFKTFLINNNIQSITDCTDSFKNVVSGKLSVFHFNKFENSNNSIFENVGIAQSIIKKMIDYAKINPTLNVKRSYFQKDNGKFELLYLLKLNSAGVITETNTGDRFIEAEKYWFTNRFFGGKNSQVFELEGNVIPSGTIMYFDKLVDMSLEEFKNLYCGNLLFEFMINEAKGKFFDTPLRAMKLIPILKDTSLQNLQKIYNLTQVEIEYIKATVK